MTTYTLTGNEQTYLSYSNPLYDSSYKMWRCTADTNADYNVVDVTGDEYTVTAAAPTISAVAFRNLFSIAEEIAISTSIDPVIIVLWGRFVDPKLTNVDMSLASVDGALDYLTNEGILAAGRKEEILTGKAV